MVLYSSSRMMAALEPTPLERLVALMKPSVSRKTARRALSASDNDVTLAQQLLDAERLEAVHANKRQHVDDDVESLDQLTGMGMDRGRARTALIACGGDVSRAIAVLFDGAAVSTTPSMDSDAALAQQLAREGVAPSVDADAALARQLARGGPSVGADAALARQLGRGGAGAIAHQTSTAGGATGARSWRRGADSTATSAVWIGCAGCLRRRSDASSRRQCPPGESSTARHNHST